MNKTSTSFRIAVAFDNFSPVRNVRACNSSGCSAWVASTVALPAPTGISGSYIFFIAGVITLNWTLFRGLKIMSIGSEDKDITGVVGKTQLVLIQPKL